MKSFSKFLGESKIDDFMGLTEGEIYSVVDGSSLVKEDANFDDLSLDEIADLNMNEPLDEDEESGVGGIASGFGGEEYVSLDASSLMSQDETTSESKKTTGKKSRKDPPIIWGDPDDIEVPTDV